MSLSLCAPTRPPRSLIRTMIVPSVAVVMIGCSIASAVAQQTTTETIERISSGDVGVRLDAIRQVAERGPAAKAAVPALIQALGSDDLVTRFEAAKALAAVGPEANAAAGPLTSLLAADSELLRYVAATALRQVADEKSDALVTGLRSRLAQDDSLAVRVAAARTLAALADENDQDPLTPSELEALIEGLASSDDHVAVDAMHGLAAVGSSATDRILPLLRSKNATERTNALQTLAFLGLAAQSAGPALIEALGESEDEDKRHVLRALAAVGADAGATVRAIRPLLRDDARSGVQLTALYALGELGADAKPAVPAIIALLGGDDARVRLEAVETLGEIGPEAAGAVPQLVAALRDEDGLMTVEAAQALSRIGSAAVGPLTELLADENYRVLAATILADVGPDAVEALPVLIRLLGSDVEDVRRSALLGLAGMGPKAEEAVPSLMTLLSDSGNPSQPGAAYALARIGAKEAIPSLLEIVRNTSDERLQMAAAWALVILEPEAEYADRAVPALVRGLSDPWELVRRECVVALAALGPRARSAADDLTELLDDPDPQVQAEALTALHAVGADLEGLLPRIIDGLNEESLDVRYASAAAIGRLGERGRQAVPRLKEMLNHRREFDRVVAAWALVKIDPTPATIQTAVPLMVRALDHPSDAVRQEAATTLGEIGKGQSDVLNALRQAANDPAADVQQAAKQALEQLSQ